MEGIAYLGQHGVDMKGIAHVSGPHGLGVWMRDVVFNTEPSHVASTGILFSDGVERWVWCDTDVMVPWVKPRLHEVADEVLKYLRAVSAIPGMSRFYFWIKEVLPVECLNPAPTEAIYGDEETRAQVLSLLRPSGVPAVQIQVCGPTIEAVAALLFAVRGNSAPRWGGVAEGGWHPDYIAKMRWELSETACKS